MPPVGEGAAVILRGQRELIRAFTAAGKAAGKEIRAELRAVAEPVRHDAESLALSEIPHMAPIVSKSAVPWWRMRVGVTTKSVYVAPVQRGVKGRGDLSRRRPKFADLMMERAMEPALERNQAAAVEAVDAVLSHIAQEWEAV